MAYAIKIGSGGKWRLFFHILNNPWATLQAIIELQEEYEKLKAEIGSLKLEANEARYKNLKLREVLYNLRGKSA
jgi:hypothetical protein